MESTTFDYSTKNIPIPSEDDYKRKLIEKTEHLCRRMRWKAFFYLNPNATPKQKENFGFNSTKTPPVILETAKFENKLLNMIENLKFRQIKDRFQQKMQTDIRTKIKNNDKLLVPADKTTNYYTMDTDSYETLLHKNVTKTYKKINSETVSEIEMQNKKITETLDIDDRVKVTAKREAFITLKDHKPNFNNNPTCRLINPAKSEIGKISKKILDNINTKIEDKTGLNQWKSTAATLKWFNNIEQKEKYYFIAFDVVDFYPSISAELLNNALDFASIYHDISSEERQIIIHAKQSCLYKSGEPWGKKATSNLFDVTMGSFDGAETCELVGLYLLNEITQKHGKNFGLYRDDGLGVSDAKPREIENIKKDLCSIFSKHGLKITIESNKKIVNFLDVTLNLKNGKHVPYNKPNNTPLYVHTESNHPPNIIKNIPIGINKRLCEISYDQESFDIATPIYQRSITNSGYKHQLKYSNEEKTDNGTKNRKNRSRNIIWYNPPYSKNVETNIGKTFLKILDEEFPKEHLLHKIFNRNTVKLSYSCMNNIKNIIDGHNKAILSKEIVKNQPKTCNCRKIIDCPMSGRCLVKSVVYRATVETNDDKPKQTYVGLTENTFKTRFTNHKASFRNPKLKNSTELSKYIWELKEENIDFNITWNILKQASPYNPASDRCNLCLWEKFYIICKQENAKLNKRNELVSTCRHSRKYLLSNFKK
jgi:hypothetical protein